MASLIWGATGARTFETGVDRGVLFPPNSAPGVAWNGLTAVNEAPTGGDAQPYYLDGIKYLQISAAEEYNATIAALSSPPEFAQCDGIGNIYAGLFITQQPRQQFGLSYRTLIGNDVELETYGYNLHLVYNALAKPTTRSNTSLADTTDPMGFSWDITTVPPPIVGFKPSAHITINSLLAATEHLTIVEAIVYGNSDTDPRQPTIDELTAIFGS